MTLFQSYPVQIQLKKKHIRDASHTDTVTYTEMPNFTDTSKIGHQY